MSDSYHIFGIRHLSPGVAHHMLRYLDRIQPECVLIEGPSDAIKQLRDLAGQKVHPPVALLAYTSTLPVQTLLYPFAEYSPEFQAIRWAVRHGKEVRFIDLPSGIMLALPAKIRRDDSPSTSSEYNEKAFHQFYDAMYEGIARGHGEYDYESYWERYIEHAEDTAGLQERLGVQSLEMRTLVEQQKNAQAAFGHSYSLLREAYMRREIEQTIKRGVPREAIVIIAGAYHVSGLQPCLPSMSDDDLKALPIFSTCLTLMPYSYLRLSSRTGYGAGNRAPHYFEMMWQALKADRPKELAATYLAKIAGELRVSGHNASTGSTIEAVRLANALSGLRNGRYPVLNDLHDAAITCLGGGELSVVAEALNKIDIGTAIGSLPEGVSQTPVQYNMNQELKRLRLTQYKSLVAREVSLDLRENLRAQSRESAFLDLERSTFFHRLAVLGIHFAEKTGSAQEKATWSEKWILRWTPETEIEIIETNLQGESLEIAAAFRLKEELANCFSLSQATRIIRNICECRLDRVFESALSIFQKLLVESVSFKETAFAARELSMLVRYGDVRRFSLETAVPVLQQIFLRASLLVAEAASCDNKTAIEVAKAINAVESVSKDQCGVVDGQVWLEELDRLANRDDLNSGLCGVAFAILLEHNRISEERCLKEVSRRLSPGIPAGWGAGWFEGLSGRNRHALLSRTFLWKELDNYVQSLDDEEFRRAVVLLRRAFSVFEPRQKNQVAELLGDLWGGNAEATAQVLHAELTEKDRKILAELNEFDFNF